MSLAGEAVAVVVCRDGRLPTGADEATAEAGGRVLVVGPGAGEEVSGALPSAAELWWAPTGASPGLLCGILEKPLRAVRLVVLPASPDGRDLAPRLAAAMGRPLLASALSAHVCGEEIRADLLRAEGRVTVPVAVEGPAVATLMPGVRPPAPFGAPPKISGLELPSAGLGGPVDPELLDLIEPDPATMDLAEASRVLAGGAGLVPPRATPEQARAIFGLLGAVAGRLGASAGATRVVTDAGWMGYDRQIGTTGVAIDPDLYVALGISGASQHIGGLGSPRHVASVNLDPSCPMTSMADLGLVADAPRTLLALARRLGVEVPGSLAGLFPGEEDAGDG